MIAALGELLACRAQWDDACACVPGLVDIAFDPVEMALIDAGHEIGVILYGGKLLSDNLFAPVDKSLDPTLGYKAIVRADAQLAAVHGFAGNDALRGQLDIALVTYYDGRLPAQFQGNRNHVFRRGAHHQAANAGGSCENEVIQWQGAESSTHLGAPGNHADFGFLEILRKQTLHDVRCVWRVLRWFHHGAIAGTQHISQRAEDHINRHVPGSHDADHALGLVLHVGFGAQEVHRHERAAFFRLHPFLQILFNELETTHRGHYIGHQGDVLGSAAKILVHRVANSFLVVHQQGDTAVDAIYTRGKGHGTFSFKSGALVVEYGLQFNRCGAFFGGCVHGVLLCFVIRRRSQWWFSCGDALARC